MTFTSKDAGRKIQFGRSLLLSAVIGAFLAGCSSNATGVSRGTGGTTSTSASSASGGATGAGGSAPATTGAGGAVGSGGTTGSGSALASGGNGAGGVSPTGGVASGGSRAAGGATGSGGASSAGGTVATGGNPATGGATGTGGTRATGGATATGGISGKGGATGAGGSTAIDGGSGTGGVTGTDRCDVGVFDSANPPKALTLSGSLGAHDPAAIESDGKYYLYATGLGAKTSTNLTTWSAASAPFGTPAWMTAAVAGVSDLWAPDISYFGGTYHLYYAGSTFGKNTSCIGHATRASLSSGSWADQGSATICSNIGTTDNWNAIDPNAVVDSDGNPWLVLGSFWGGIKIIQLDQTGARVGTTVTGIAARPSSGGAIEGAFMVRRCGYYYLFSSWDKCCNGASSTYNIRVVRGTSVTGPFADKAGTAAMQGGGTLIAQSDSTWAGPGGQSVMFVGTKAYLVYHAYAMSNGAATLRIADLIWDADGWPMPVGP